MPYEDRYDEEREQGISPAPQKMLAFGLIAIGVVIALWSFGQVYNIFTNPEELTVFQQLVSDEVTFKMTIDDEEVRVEPAPEVLAYIIPLLLLAVAVSIAKLFITAGVNLYHSNLRKLMLRVNSMESGLEQHKADMRGRFDELKETCRTNQ
jgi:hypothetical protein